MFPSQVPTYNDDDLIGTSATTADSNFDTSHQLYQAITQLAQLTQDHPALRNGVQQHRYSTDAAGIYAYSRFDHASQREYVVALNNSESPQSALVPTSAGPGAGFDKLYGDGAAALVTDPARRLPVVVPALSAVIYRSAGAVPQSGAAPGIEIAPLPDGGDARGRVEVRAFVDGSSFYDVAFQANVSGGGWNAVGIDDNRPYRVFHDLSGLPAGTTVQYRAVVLDNAGNSRTSDPFAIEVAGP
jgi:hypothetical protein